ncbi:hypothetical protein DFJ73DRAFT_880100 [Zopfochytrium polystomum]|nr:hypothetical protein DFJ73DRAFT_880100 [Zopfochytrium polystomum]
MAFVFALPMEHVYTNTRMAPLGLLALLSFSGVSVVLSVPYLNRANPLYDAPATRLYKSVAVLSVVLTFAMVLQLALRYNTLIFDIAFSGAATRTNVPPPNVAKNLTQLRRTLLTLQALLQSLPPLLVFSSAEIRLEAKFPKADYAELVERMGRILDYLASAATSLRGKGFGREFGLYAIASAELVAARKQLFSATRLLFFVFASAIQNKDPLPSEIPALVPLRNQVFRSYHQREEASFDPDTTSGDAGQVAVVGKGTREEWMQFLSFSLAMRLLAVELDKLGEAVRRIVGSEDPADWFDEDDAETIATGAV